MDVARFIVESANFTRATLFFKPSRWLIFVLLGLPWMAISVLIEGHRILEGTAIRWNLVPWPDTGLLIAAGILCNFLLSGWVVRLLRDDPVPPEFDRPLALCLDGIKVHTIPLVWMLAPTLLAFVQFSLAGGSAVSVDLWHPNPAARVILLLLTAQIVIVLIAVQYITIGAIRFARTGRMADAFALREIWKTTVRIGIVNYYTGRGSLSLSGWFSPSASGG